VEGRETDESAKIQVSGLHGEDEFVRERVNEMIQETLSKITRSIPVMSVVIHVETHNKGGERNKYSVQGRFVTDVGSLHADDTEWNLTKAFGLFLGKIEREAQRKMEKERGH